MQSCHSVYKCPYIWVFSILFHYIRAPLIYFFILRPVHILLHFLQHDCIQILINHLIKTHLSPWYKVVLFANGIFSSGWLKKMFWILHEEIFAWLSESKAVFVIKSNLPTSAALKGVKCLAKCILAVSDKEKGNHFAEIPQQVQNLKKQTIFFLF